MDIKTYSVRLASWIGIIEEANKSGLSKTAWCKQNGVRYRQFQYWQKKIRDFIMENPDMPKTELPHDCPPSSDTSLQPSFCEISVPPDTSSQMSENDSDTVQTPPADAPGSHMMSSHLMLKVSQYQLFIGDGFSERDLSSVIRVLGNA